MRKISAVFLVISLVFSIPSAKAEELGRDQYIAGYQDGFEAGFRAGYASALEESDNQNSVSLPEEKEPPENGHIFLRPTDKQVVPLTIETADDEYYFFVLTKLGTHRRVMTFFAYGNSTTKVSVPVGAYKIYFASGQTWYGQTDLFGDDTVYWCCDEIFPFTEKDGYYSGWTVTLYPVEDGNLNTSVIDKSEFP